MKKLLLFLFGFSLLNLSAQVAINNSGATPDASAMLDISSTSSGLLIPRMSAADRDNIGSPATGLTVFVTDDNSFYYYDGTNWVNLSTQPDEDWKVDGSNMYSIPIGNVGIGTNVPLGKFHVVDDKAYMIFDYDRLSLKYTYDNTHFPYIEWRDNDGVRGMYLGWGSPGSLVNMQLENGNNLNIGGGLVGVNNSSPQYQLDVIGNDVSRVGNFISTRTSTDDIAVYGNVANTDNYGIGGYFQGGWIGLESYVAPSGDASYFGLYNTVNGGNGTNYGIYSYVDGNGDSYGFYGYTSVTAGNGTSGLFYNGDDSGIGLISIGNNLNNYYYSSSGAGIVANGSYLAIVGYTDLDDSSATAVMGRYTNSGNYADATGIEGYSAPSDYWGYGVKGYGGYYGVYGEDINGSAAIYANGDLAASGTKNFMIDYPLDPANKILKHFSIESNEVLNVYRGNVILNQQGEATIQMPVYFKAINKNYSYQLTAIGSAANGVFVKKEIGNGNTFVIAGGNPGQKISWVVYAERNDPYLQYYPEKRKVIIDKKLKEKGKYIRPELYGKGQNNSMFNSVKLPYKKTKIQKKIKKK